MHKIIPALLLISLLLSASPADAQGFVNPRPVRGPSIQSFGFLFRRPLPTPVPPFNPVVNAAPEPSSPGASCRAAIAAAELRYGIPTGLLAAIGMVESGRADPVTGNRQPWPWTVNAGGDGRYFESKAQAIAWVREAQARGTSSIDTGCLQVNLKHHPDAFASLEDAFDPVRNTDYAARFLQELYQTVAGGDWMRAAGYYHSQTPERAAPYRAMVQQALNGSRLAPDPTVTQTAAESTVPTGGGQALSNAAERAMVLPLAPGLTGRSLASYRATPIQITGRIVPARLLPTQR